MFKQNLPQKRDDNIQRMRIRESARAEGEGRASSGVDEMLDSDTVSNESVNAIFEFRQD